MEILPHSGQIGGGYIRTDEHTPTFLENSLFHVFLHFLCYFNIFSWRMILDNKGQFNLVWLTVWLNDMLVSNTTVTSSSLDLHVSTHSPVGSPRVLDQPVVFASLISITNNSDLMVKSPDTVRVRYSLTTS